LNSIMHKREKVRKLDFLNTTSDSSLQNSIINNIAMYIAMLTQYLETKRKR